MHIFIYNDPSQILGVTWHGEATVYNGWLRGLATIFREGDANFVYDEEGRIRGMKSEFGIGGLEVTLASSLLYKKTNL